LKEKSSNMTMELCGIFWKWDSSTTKSGFKNEMFEMLLKSDGSSVCTKTLISAKMKFILDAKMYKAN
jgi:hypothetical protein